MVLLPSLSAGSRFELLLMLVLRQHSSMLDPKEMLFDCFISIRQTVHLFFGA
jgi:hypothetical protein